jgi:hypothetical protein
MAKERRVMVLIGRSQKDIKGKQVMPGSGVWSDRVLS